MLEKRTYIPCQSCRMLDFRVLHSTDTGTASVVCANCGEQFFAAQVEAPAERVTARAV